jgi:hypothetical protein
MDGRAMKGGLAARNGKGDSHVRAHGRACEGRRKKKVGVGGREALRKNETTSRNRKGGDATGNAQVGRPVT